MSAQGRIAGQVMEAYCENEPGFLLCRTVYGDLQWVGYTFLFLFVVLPVIGLVIQFFIDNFKNGKIPKLLSWQRFLTWFKDKKNTKKTVGYSLLSTFLFIEQPLLMPLGWFTTAFIIYMHKNWKKEE